MHRLLLLINIFKNYTLTATGQNYKISKKKIVQAAAEILWSIFRRHLGFFKLEFLLAVACRVSSRRVVWIQSATVCRNLEQSEQPVDNHSCRKASGSMNWILDDSGLSPTENLKTGHELTLPMPTRSVSSRRVGDVNRIGDSWRESAGFLS